MKAVSKRAKQKSAEASGDLITKVSKSDVAKNEIEVPKERYISPEKIQQIIDELR